MIPGVDMVISGFQAAESEDGVGGTIWELGGALRARRGDGGEQMVLKAV
jgi:hypothetical protein